MDFSRSLDEGMQEGRRLELRRVGGPNCEARRASCGIVLCGRLVARVYNELSTDDAEALHVT